MTRGRKPFVPSRAALDRACREYRSGATLPEVAAVLGVASAMTARRIIASAGVTIRPRGVHKPQARGTTNRLPPEVAKNASRDGWGGYALGMPEFDKSTRRPDQLTTDRMAHSFVLSERDRMAAEERDRQSLIADVRAGRWIEARSVTSLPRSFALDENVRRMELLADDAYRNRRGWTDDFLLRGIDWDVAENLARGTTLLY